MRTRLRVVIARNAFKASLTARQAAEAMAAGVARVLPDAEIVPVPVADDGDGLVDVAIDALGGEPRTRTVTNRRTGLLAFSVLPVRHRA